MIHSNLAYGVFACFQKGKLQSKPWNPVIANAFYRAGVIERWGTGTLNIIDWCAENGNPPPTWLEQAGSVFIIFMPAALEVTPQVTPQVTPEVTPEVAPEVMRLLSALHGTMDRQSLQRALKLRAEKNFRLVYLRPALEAGLIEMTIPDKPRSSKQKYRLTEKGKKFLNEGQASPK